MLHVKANRAWNLIVNVGAASPFLIEERRLLLYRLGGIDLAGTSIRPGCSFATDLIKFGPGGMVNEGCTFGNREPVTVGAHVFLGPQVLIETSTHRYGPTDHRAGDYTGRPVMIGDGCWIGARAMILPGVDVAPGCVIAAGAVVTQDTDADGLYGGAPAVRKRSL